ncbi:MAG: hypothetical protein AB8B69_24720 [Chitinophagales bacterium]
MKGKIKIGKSAKKCLFCWMNQEVTSKELLTIRADDLPLLYSLIRTLDISKIVNETIVVHKNWEGLLPGEILEIWLCYFLSTCDHRLSCVEEWIGDRIELFEALSGGLSIRSYDFTDDKLGLLLEYFSETASWDLIENGLNKNILEVYSLGSSEFLTFRLDAAPMQSYGKVSEGGLLQYGYHKHHANLPQFKLKLCTLDNEVNHFAYPICHLSVSGNEADDGLYIPIMEQSKKVLSKLAALSCGNLYVGDKKFGSIGNRLYCFASKDYYLVPLSLVQLSAIQREEIIDKHVVSAYEKVTKQTKDNRTKLVAEGFEEVVELEGQIEGQAYKWMERRLWVRSVSYRKSQCLALDKRLTKAQRAIEQLTISKQGKKTLNSLEEYQIQISKILKDNKVKDLIKVDIEVSETIREVRAYGKNPKRTEKKRHFKLTYKREEELIEKKKRYFGWQVYATNASKELLPYEKCVWKYRHQSNIESRFDDLRNKVAPLLPVFLQKDNRIKGLVNILLLALKVCSMIEYKVAKALQDEEEQLEGLYEGNPKRKTNKPSAKRICRVFEGISIALIFVDKKLLFAIMTELQPIHLKILKLLGIDSEVYRNLAANIQILFSHNQVTET